MICDACGYLTGCITLGSEPVGFDRERLRLLSDGSERGVDVGQGETLAIEGNPSVAQPGRLGQRSLGPVCAAGQRSEFLALDVQRALLGRQLAQLCAQVRHLLRRSVGLVLAGRGLPGQLTGLGDLAGTTPELAGAPVGAPGQGFEPIGEPSPIGCGDTGQVEAARIDEPAG